MTLHRPHALSLSLSLALALVLAPLSLASLAACSAVQSVQGMAANALLPVSEENKLGAQMSKEVEKDLKVHKNEDVQNYIEKIGNRLAKKARDTPQGIKFRFKVIDDDKTINAFAIPGGHIYIYSGLMKAASDEAELAGVIGHEIAHVTQRHIAERLVAQYGLETVIGLALGKDPGLLGSIAAQVGGTGALLKFTRDQEHEADARGMPYMVAAGYDPDAMVSFFKKLQKGEGPRALVFLNSHPLPSDRVEALQARIKKMRNKPDTRNKEQLDAIKSKL